MSDENKTPETPDTPAPAPKPAAAASMRVAPTSIAAKLLATPIARLWWP